MRCPKCEATMERVTFQDVEVDRCTYCRGLWFDLREHERLKGMAGSEAIDVGNAAFGEKCDDLTTADCPHCHTPMIRMADLRQPHIHYEACTVCHGVFFDAGEFRDYKEETVTEFLLYFWGRAKG